LTTSVGARVALAVLLVPAGVVVSLATVAVHARWWGLLLGLATTAAWLVALRGWTRLPFALGWVVVLAFAAPARPEGDVVVANDAAGWLLLAAGVVVLLAGISGLRRRPPEESRPSGITGPRGGAS
jgi:hypothetical protein